jgi:SAM-dependent methyltransferase
MAAHPQVRLDPQLDGLGAGFGQPRDVGLQVRPFRHVRERRGPPPGECGVQVFGRLLVLTRRQRRTSLRQPAFEDVHVDPVPGHLERVAGRGGGDRGAGETRARVEDLPQLVEGQDSFSDWYRDLDQVRGFMEAMDSACAPVTAALAESFDWSGVTTVADLGGARGNLVAQLARRHRHLTGVCFDLPAVQPLFDEHVTALGTADRVTFQGDDFRTDPLPEADVLIFGHILHDWDEETRARLVRRAFDAVRPGGALLIYDELLDDDRRGPARSLLMSLNMKLVRTGGSEYTAEQCRTWLHEAGFTEVTVRPLTATERLVVARKP